MTELKEDFVVQCAVCKRRYTNHAGSTECCGSVAELLDDNMEPVGSWVFNVASVSPSMLGWLEGVAIEYLIRNDKKFRVVKRDDKDFVVTQDFNPERYNLVVEHGHIKRVYLG